MLRVGLTGGIACGKSRVLRRLEALGHAVLDLDLVAHAVMAPGGKAFAPVVAAFGSGILARDGAIDRKALGALVFADGAKRERLNAIVHPLVRAEEQARAEAFAREGRPLLVTDAALLVESGVHLRFDRLVVVHCAEEEQLRRLMAREALALEQAKARIRAQMPLGEKRRFAHFDVDTSGALEKTDAAAEALAGRLVELAREPAPPLPAGRELLVALLAGAGEPALPERLLEDVAAHGGLEMRRVAALLGRPADRPWLAAAGEGGLADPSSLMGPVAAWCLSRRGGDLELLGVASMSIARAATADAGRVAQACATAWTMARFAAEPAAPLDLQAAAAFGGRWAGAKASPPAWSPAAATAARPSLLAAIDRFLERR